jgi:hypothetical protein
VKRARSRMAIDYVELFRKRLDHDRIERNRESIPLYA